MGVKRSGPPGGHVQGGGGVVEVGHQGDGGGAFHSPWEGRCTCLYCHWNCASFRPPGPKWGV